MGGSMAEDGDRLRCWALGARVRESVDWLARNARELAQPMGTGEREARLGVLRVQMNNLSALIGQSEGKCGIEPVVRSDFERLRGAIGKEDPSTVNRYADDFAAMLHGEALEKSAYPTGGRVRDLTERDAMEENLRRRGVDLRSVAGIAKAVPGRYPFIDAEAFWDSLDGVLRRSVLTELNFVGPDYDDYPERPYGALDKDFQDVLEAYVVRRRPIREV